MNRRKGFALAALACGLALVASQVRSNGVCLYAITGGAVAVSSPTSGQCIVSGTNWNPSASYYLYWKVTGINGSSPCDAPVTWEQTGSVTDPTGCGFDSITTDWIRNASIGTNGSFSNTVSTTCTALATGNWAFNASVLQGGSTYATTGHGYSIKTSCP